MDTGPNTAHSNGLGENLGCWCNPISHHIGFFLQNQSNRVFSPSLTTNKVTSKYEMKLGIFQLFEYLYSEIFYSSVLYGNVIQTHHIYICVCVLYTLYMILYIMFLLIFQFCFWFIEFKLFLKSPLVSRAIFFLHLYFPTSIW